MQNEYYREDEKNLIEKNSIHNALGCSTEVNRCLHRLHISVHKATVTQRAK